MSLAADDVTALDTDSEVLINASELARACGIKNISFAVGDAYRLPFADRSFDTVTLLEVLEHLERPSDAVSEAVRVARERVIITVPAKGYMTNSDGHIQDFAIEDIVAMLPHADYAQIHPPFTFVLYDKSE
jgi:ubiquinone/menaquinone biosynthesis C-methylase UbiE